MPAPNEPFGRRPPLLSRLWRWMGRVRVPALPAEPPASAVPLAPMAPPIAAPAGPSLADYRIEHVVARSDRASVYRAVARASGRTVALKTVKIGDAADLDRGLWRERFLREAEAARRLEHEHIVQVLAAGIQTEGGTSLGWLAMEWVPGTDLSRYANVARLLPEAIVLAIGSRVALALDHAHRAGIVHRDIKPANILFDPTTGCVKVTDFGSARVADATATRSGVIVGTPAYMAPEQLAGAEATPQCDLYALGTLLFELLAGHPPFEADSMGELLSRIAHQPPPRLEALRPDLPQILDDILGRLMAKRPGDRHANGRLVALELRLAQNACGRAVPGSVAAAWADTQPADMAFDEFPEEIFGQGDETATKTIPDAPEADSMGPAGTVFRGTMDDPLTGGEKGMRRSLSPP